VNVKLLRWELYKARFFDRPIKGYLSDQARAVLSRFGAFVRRDAKSSMRRKGTKRTPHSQPGQPPFSPTGTLPQWILFAYDPRDKSVTIGPYKLNMIFFDGDGQPVRGTVPEALEFGGQIRVLEVLSPMPVVSGGKVTGFADRWVRADLRSRRRNAGLPTRLRAAYIAARPYMGPAYRKNLPLLRQWRRTAA
jgi:hypothetical protein